MVKSEIVKSFCTLHFDFYLLTFTFLIWALFSQPAFSEGTKTKGSLKSPSAFIENKGQIVDQKYKPNPEVLYLLNTPGFNVQLRRGGFSYDLYRISNIDQRILKDEFSASRVSRYALRDSNSASGIRHPASEIQHRASSIIGLISTS